jgi:Xaa-Pro aminopeptidase
VHYRVTETSNRPLDRDSLLLVDSGAQYQDGTTDITRTLPIGTPSQEMRQAFTRVLRGMIAISQLRFPEGLAGRDIDAIARAPLWAAGQDYDHGTGHGVGSFLSVHEGPQRLSRAGDVPLQPGMILSNEPGYYRPGAFGIRIENLITVIEAEPLPGGDDRAMLAFETLTYAPIDLRLIEASELTKSETDWLDAYHHEVYTKLSPLLAPPTGQWLAQATRSI